MPAYAVSVVVFSYWSYVVAMLVRMRRRARWKDAAVPRQPLERAMWIIWVPLIILWIALPIVGANQSERYPWLAIPTLAYGPVTPILRWTAAALALTAFIASIACWRFMGSCWRMAVDDKVSTLLTSGPFSKVRHPIYTLSMGLMICTAVAAPSRAMLIIAAIHLTLLITKAANEERFLLNAHGDRYATYVRQTGRFLPRLHG